MPAKWSFTTRPQHNKSMNTPTADATAPPTRRRAAKAVNYAEPKLNTKLRQAQTFLPPCRFALCLRCSFINREPIATLMK